MSDWKSRAEKVGTGDWKSRAAPVDDSFSAETALRSYGNAATMGYGDNIRAATEPAVFALLNALTGENVESDGDYVQRRDEEIKRTHQLQEENPKSSMVGTGLGVGASALVPAAGLFKGATATARIANTAANAGLMGALQNPGEIEGELSGLQLADRLKNAGTGIAIGGGLQAGGEIISKVAEKAPQMFKRFANEKAVKTAGAMKKDFKNMSDRQVQELGDRFLEDGVVTPLATPTDVSNRISKKIGETSQELQGQIQKADEVLWRPEGFNMENATTDQIEAFKKAFVPTSQIKEEVIQNFRNGFDGVPEEELAPAIEKIEAWFKNRPENMSIDEFQKMKTGLNNFLKKSDFYRDMPGIGKEGLLAVRRGAKEAIENKANAAADILGEQGGQIRATNKKFGQYLEGQDLADDAIGRASSNRMISLTDTIAGAGGLTVAGIPGAIATAALNKAGRAYANPLMATGSNAVSKNLKAVNDYIQKSPVLKDALMKSPAAAAAITQNLLARMNQGFEPQEEAPFQQPPRRLGESPESASFKAPDKNDLLQKVQGSKYEQVLRNAESRGDDAFNAAHFVLSQRDKDYRKYLEQKDAN